MAITSGKWEGALWKKSLHKNWRISQVSAEYLMDEFNNSIFPYPGNPISVFEKSFVSACFCIRRLSEKLLLSDNLNEKSVPFKFFSARDNDFQPPLPGSASNMFYENYKFDTYEEVLLKLRDFSNEVIHSSLLGVVNESESLHAGILVASDWRMSKRLIYLTFSQWEEICMDVLTDRVFVAIDEWDPETGKTRALRLSKDQSGLRPASGK